MNIAVMKMGTAVSKSVWTTAYIFCKKDDLSKHVDVLMCSRRRRRIRLNLIYDGQHLLYAGDLSLFF